MKRIIVLLLSAAFIVLLMPVDGVVPVSMQVGQRWNQGTLIAPFDIPIQKSAATLDKERRDASMEAKSVYDIDTTVGYARLLDLREFLGGGEVGVLMSESRVDSIVEALCEVYRRGVIGVGDYSSGDGRSIYLSYGGDTLRSAYLEGLYTPPMVLAELSGVSGGLSNEFFTPYVQPNVTYNNRLSSEIWNNTISDMSHTEGVVRRGEVIVIEGQVIDMATLKIIDSYNSELESRLSSTPSRYLTAFARFVIVLSVLLLSYLFLSRFPAHYLGQEMRKMTFGLVLILFVSVLLGVALRIEGVSPYVIPLPIVSIFLLTFFNMRVAILGNISATLICSLFVSFSYDFLVINTISGMVAIFMMRHFYFRGKLMRALGSIIISQVVLYCCLALLREGRLEGSDYLTIVWILVSALLFLGLYQLIYFVERFFGLVSDITLLELCDTNQPLLMELAQNAPGTFQHSVQVANLAESAAKEIGANPLLARTGALYHDVGKIKNPYYFVENLTGSFNPHNDQSAEQSVAVIKAHISDGLSVARKHNLPQVVQDFIEQHHGESLIYFFYNKAKEVAEKGEEIEQKEFRYLGPKPISREVSICMMADAVEAASRSLPSYEKEIIDGLVDDVVDSQIKDGQFSASQLTFEEINTVKQLFKSKLNNIYHGRIAYPSRQ